MGTVKIYETALKTKNFSGNVLLSFRISLSSFYSFETLSKCVKLFPTLNDKPRQEMEAEF